MNISRLLLFIISVLFLIQPAHAWETDIVSKYSGWKAIYNGFGKSMEQEANSKDEHAALSDWALRALGVKRYTYNSDPIMITDLNASFFRKSELGSLGSYPSAPGDGKLEIRQLPAPSHFSGIPDYSYTLYDWINKNNYCPPHEGLFLCHDFKGWMGALNSNHFGTQAKNAYWHLHKLAINLANHAKRLRESFSKDKTAIETYKVYIREAEREALSVEGYAQHFLQDRWSIGHMWERWDAPDYEHLSEKGLDPNLVIGAFSGLLHGSEGITGKPDALSSPQVSWSQTHGTFLDEKHLKFPESFKKTFESSSGLILPRWKNQTDNQQKGDKFIGFPGVGDDRFLDLLDNHFGKEYKSIGRDYYLGVGAQKDRMKQCLMAGWSEVIHSFGKNSTGGYGIERSKPLGNIKGFSSLGFKCDDQWATNASIALGWFDKIGGIARTFGHIARALIKFGPHGPQINLKHNMGSYMKKRVDLMGITWRIYEFGIQLKYWRNNTTLARGGIKSLGEAKTGNKYPEVASYVEPEDINKLPDEDERGGDKKAWFGFFNRSHADYWCGQEGVDVLKKMRGSNNAKTQLACEYLADRFYEGTDPYYKGNYQESRTVNHRENGQSLHSVCHYFGGRKLWNPNPPYNVPFYLSGGYVGDPYARINHDSNSDGYDTVGNWCAKVPVLNYVREKNGEMRGETVAKIKTWDDPITVRGENLGMDKGKLRIDCNQFGSLRVPDEKIQSWNDGQIKFDLSWLPEKKRKEETHYICIETAEGKNSVGLFNVKAKEPKAASAAKGELKSPIQGCWRSGGSFSWSDPSQNLNAKFSFKITALTGNSLRAVMHPLGEDTPAVRWNGYYDPDSGITEFYLVNPKEMIQLGRRVFPGVDEDGLDKLRIKYGYDFILRFKTVPPDTVIGSDTQMFGIAKRFEPEVGRNSTGNIEIGYGGTWNLGDNESWGGNLINLWTRLPPAQVSNLNVISTDKEDSVQAIHEGQMVRLRARVDAPCSLGGDHLIVKVSSERVNLFDTFYVILHRDRSLDAHGDQKANFISNPFKFNKIHYKVALDVIGQKHLIAFTYRSGLKGKPNTQYARLELNDKFYNSGSFYPGKFLSTVPNNNHFQHEMLSAGRQLYQLKSSSEGLQAIHPSRFLRIIDKLYPSFIAGWETAIGTLDIWIKDSVDALKECQGSSFHSPNECEIIRRELDEQKAMQAKLKKAHAGISMKFNTLPDNSDRLESHSDSLGSLEKWKAKFNDDIAMTKGFILRLENERYFPGMYVNMDKLSMLRRDMMLMSGLHLREIVEDQTDIQRSISKQARMVPEIARPLSLPSITPQKIKAKPAVKPAASKPKQKPQKKKNPNQSKPVKWTVYKLVVQIHGSRLPTMDVLKLSFQKGATRAAFRVMRYPVSMARNDQTGKIIWSINSVGDVVENQMVIQKDMIDALETMANDKKKGSVEKSALAGMINRQLGPDAQQKK